MHQTPIEYLLNYRVEQAKKLLRHSELSITDIALRAGFSTSAYFSKIFKERVGMTLREYRQRQG
ncbi:helix-turn-helix domain-containing protein [Limosilactobacillus reuteri]|uniref:helix-turn-helix domain-containing protein n=1 Tax=Limosilactobacillus reuteri TaxID=1598 RepID=UPI001E587C90|nr:helix-turn-helix transcriptional regulator [Limosilactobacillus reuteri]MCR1863275.1 helix-turn-helix transcriptional regulator [Limosilactobacillus reuteri]MCR1892935.1 helix-turn-helix transcriptional regulator [Limosilactobacillus reuteri]